MCEVKVIYYKMATACADTVHCILYYLKNLGIQSTTKTTSYIRKAYNLINTKII